MCSARTKKRKLGMQMLENRRLMAGDVAVSVVNGDLHIQEAPGNEGHAQQVQLYRLSSGAIRVQGIGDTAVRSEIQFNGIPMTIYRSYVDVNVTDDIFVDLGGGNDWLSMLNYNGGIDADLVDIDVDGSGRDNDIVSISGLTTTDELKIDTGAGSDQVSVSNSHIGDSGWEDLEIDTGAGADHVNISLTTVADDIDVDMFSSASEADVDKLRIDGVTADDILADLGNGDDEAVVQFSTIHDDVDLDMGYDYAANGQDNDYVFLGYNDVDDIEIRGRDGNDDVRFAFNQADDVHFDGGSGVDRFFSWYSAPGQDSNDVDDLDLDSAVFYPYGYV